MVRKILLASAGAMALTGSAALAADLAPPPPPVPVFSWTGLYLGGQVGYAWSSGNLIYAGYDPFSVTAFGTNVNGAPQGIIGGAHVGYNYQFNQFVVGLEGTVDGTSLSNSVTTNFSNAFAGSTVAADTSSDVQGSIRARIGYAWERALLYATGGVAFGSFSTTYNLTGNISGIIGESSPGAADGQPFYGMNKFSNTRTGWTVGGGIDYAVTDNWSVFAEYRYTNFGTVSAPGLAAAGFTTVGGLTGAYLNANRSLNQSQVQVGFTYKFGTYAPPPVVAKY